MTVVKPRRLRPGDRIGVVAPSGGVTVQERLDRGLTALRRFGFEPVLGPVASSAPGGAPEPTSRDRAEEINDFVRDPTVRGIIAAIGGHTANTVLPHLDYAAWRADPTVLVGYSDITALLVAVYSRSGVATFHGPTVLAELGEHPAPLPFTAAAFLRATGSAEPLGVLSPAPAWTDDFLPWGVADDQPRSLRSGAGWSWVCPGVAEGVLLGGNLDTLSVLVGTPYLPSFAGSVLVCESAASSPGPIVQHLEHLRAAGALVGVTGVLFGRSFRGGEDLERSVNRVVVEMFAPLGVPVVTGVDLGHCDPMLTLPLGTTVRLDSSTATVTVLDSGVA